VYENTRSPTVYLSRERDPAKAKVPASADPSAPPRWRRIAAAKESVVWHDHRIHWVKRQPPRVVANDPTEPKLVFRWRIPGTADRKPFAITGFLGYTPPPQAAAEATAAGTSPWLIAAVAAISVLLVAGLAVGARRTRRQAPTSSPSD
jgi:hypothetical protein